MTVKQNLNLDMKALQFTTFVPLPSRVKGEYLKEKWVECLTQSDFNLPIRKVKIYDLHGNLTLTEYYRVFLEEPWPGSGGDQRADQPLNCTAMCDNANGNIHDKNR